ncbi:MAG: hypothetical protein R3F05_18825 [Planctomycetota bacterium]
MAQVADGAWVARCGERVVGEHARVERLVTPGGLPGVARRVEGVLCLGGLQREPQHEERGRQA